MNRRYLSPSWALTALFPLLLTPPMLASDGAARTDADRVPSRTTLFGDGVIHSAPDEDSLHVIGRSYEAAATPQGLTFSPFLGPDAPVLHRLALRLDSVTLGGEPLTFEGDARLDRKGDRLILDRGPVEVRYDADRASLEQSFAIDLPAGAGDLVLRIGFDSDLVAGWDAEGIRFDGPRGGVRYGAAFALDGRGGRHDVASTLEENAIVLTVPARVVARAGDRIVIDPVLTSFTAEVQTFEISDPVVAYDVDLEHYCFVATLQVALGQTRLISGFFDSQGNTFGVLLAGTAGNNWSQLDMAFVRFAGRFMVVGRKEGAGGFPDGIVGMLVDSGPPQVRSFFSIEPDGGAGTVQSPVVSGDQFLGQASFFLVAFLKEGAFGTGVHYVTLTGTGQQVSPVETLDAGAGAVCAHLSSSCSTGDAGLLTNHVFAWARDNADGESVEVAQLSFDGGVLQQRLTIFGPDPVANVEETAVTSLTAHLSPSTGLQHCAVAYRTSGFFSSSERVALISASTLHETVELRTLLNRASTTPRRGYAWITNEDALTLVHSRGTGLVATELQILGDRIAPVNREYAVGAEARPDGYGAASMYEGGGPTAGTSNLPVILHVQEVPAGGYELVATVLFELLPGAGVIDCRSPANSTGEPGFLQVYGTRDLTTLVVTVIEDLPPNALGLAVMSRTTGFVPNVGTGVGTLCLGGDIGRTSVFQVDAAGSTILPFDPMDLVDAQGPTAAVSGETWHFQAWHRDVVGGMATSNLTNAAALTFN